jgi:hypothetical protein
MLHGNSLCIYLNKNVFFFTKTELEGKTGPVWELVPVGRGRMRGEAVAG